MDIDQMFANALIAAKSAHREIYLRRYAGGPVTVIREPNDHTFRRAALYSWNYSKASGVSVSSARAHLRRLASAGRIVDEGSGRRFGACRFRLSREDTDQVGREIIAELRADGLQFDDDWRAEREAARDALRRKGGADA